MIFPLKSLSTPTMASEQYQKGKIKLLHTKSKVRKAGENIRKGKNIEESTEIIRNFRAAHLYPLMIIKNLLDKHTKKVCATAVIARRLKRLPTIIDKLQRKTLDGETKNAIAVSNMCDIGGCRVIVGDKNELIGMFNSLKSSLDGERTKHKLKKDIDYINNKKKTGYRSIHLIYECFEKEDTHDWKGFKIEVQLRTKLQHLWATTVEVVDLCESKTLKTNPFDSDPHWIEYFNIMSDFLAYEDGFVRLTNTQMNQMKERILFLNDKLRAKIKLSSFTSMFSTAKKNVPKNSKYTVLAIDEKKKEILYFCFTARQKEKALELYAQIEDMPSFNGVFIHMDDLSKIQIAYPNYLIDTREFIKKYDYYTKASYWVNPRE